MKRVLSAFVMTFIILISGCEKPDHIILHRDSSDMADGMTTLLYFNKTVTLLKLGERYGESVYIAAYDDKNGGRFDQHSFARFHIPEEYDPQLGEAVRLTADIRVTSGGIDGAITNYIDRAEDIREYEKLSVTDEKLRSAIPLWSKVPDECFLSLDKFSRGGVVGPYIFRYEEEGAVYMISPELELDSFGCTLTVDGQTAGTYEGSMGVRFDDLGGENYFMILCDEDLDVSRLNEPYTERAEDFYLLGTVYPRGFNNAEIFPGSARLKEGAELEKERFVISSEEDWERYGDFFEDRDNFDTVCFFIKSENRLDVTEISVDMETNRLCMILEKTDIPCGGYSVTEIQPEALAGVDISDFSYIIK